MKNVSRIIIFIAAALMCLGTASCMKDTTIQYDNMTMGNVEGSTFVSDQGNIFNVVEYEGNYYDELMKTERAYILCDVLSKTAGGQDNEYDIRLNAMVKVLTKDIITLGTETTEEMVKEDPVDVKSIWLSGGYMNFYIEFPVRKNSQTAHMVNLIQKEAKEGYAFTFTHNANGETREAYPDEEFDIAGGYISFPINTLIQENEAKLRVEWTWYKTYGVITSTETEVKGIEGTYKKDGFEHMPKSPTQKPMAVIR